MKHSYPKSSSSDSFAESDSMVSYGAVAGYDENSKPLDNSQIGVRTFSDRFLDGIFFVVGWIAGYVVMLPFYPNPRRFE